jgi:hypothetical protein
MNRLLGLLMFGLATVCAGASIGSAQSMFDMKGTWNGTSKSIVSGLPLHHPTTTPAKAAGMHRLTELKITIKIEGQEDGRFWGSLASPATVEPVIGVLSPDSKRLRMITQGGGMIEGIVLENGSIEIFYLENKAGVSVAATNTFTRQK